MKRDVAAVLVLLLISAAGKASADCASSTGTMYMKGGAKKHVFCFVVNGHRVGNIDTGMMFASSEPAYLGIASTAGVVKKIRLRDTKSIAFKQSGETRGRPGLCPTFDVVVTPWKGAPEKGIVHVGNMGGSLKPKGGSKEYFGFEMCNNRKTWNQVTYFAFDLPGTAAKGQAESGPAGSGIGGTRASAPSVDIEGGESGSEDGEAGSAIRMK